jgi:putative hemolysin
VPRPWASYGATGLVVVLITYFSIVVGELVPKRMGQTHPETWPAWWRGPSTGWPSPPSPSCGCCRCPPAAAAPAGREGNQGNAVTEEEIHAMLAEGTTAGVIESHEHAMVRNVFRLDDRQIGSLMVPRSRHRGARCRPALRGQPGRIEVSDHARFPVVKGGLDNVRGRGQRAPVAVARAARTAPRELPTSRCSSRCTCRRR